MLTKSYFIDAARLEMKLQGFDGLACDPDAYECNGCSLENLSPDDCLNPDCYGAHWTDEDDGVVRYKLKRMVPRYA